MKWYFAINEAGAESWLGLHAKLAVTTAQRVGDLSPHLLYLGQRNDFTAWMEQHGARVIDAAPTFLPAIEQAIAAGRHPPGFAGHWLRTTICQIEHEAEFVLYTDCDVMFRKPLELDAIRPEFIACGPEFRADNWSYFNSGVMVMNVPALRAEYPDFERHVLAALERAGRHVDDQIAYNDFYRGRWTRLDPALNWKPYWGFHERAVVTHWHGPKLDTMRMTLDGHLGWDHPHGQVIGSLFTTGLPAYAAHLEDMLALLGPAPFDGREIVERLLHDTRQLHRVVRMDRIDLSFMM